MIGFVGALGYKYIITRRKGSSMPVADEKGSELGREDVTGVPYLFSIFEAKQRSQGKVNIYIENRQARGQTNIMKKEKV